MKSTAMFAFLAWAGSLSALAGITPVPTFAVPKPMVFQTDPNAVVYPVVTIPAPIATNPSATHVVPVLVNTASATNPSATPQAPRFANTPVQIGWVATPIVIAGAVTPAAIAEGSGNATQARWPKSSRQLRAIDADVKNGSLTTEQALQFKAEIKAIHARYGMQSSVVESGLDGPQRASLIRDLEAVAKKVKLASETPKF